LCGAIISFGVSTHALTHSIPKTLHQSQISSNHDNNPIQHPMHVRSPRPRSRWWPRRRASRASPAPCPPARPAASSTPRCRWWV
jgi:hypothetical protein